MVLTLTNVLYLLNSPSNLVTVGLLNDTKIYHHNKDQIFYNHNTQKTLAFIKRYKTSFLFHRPNLFSAAVNLPKKHEVYKEQDVDQT